MEELTLNELRLKAVALGMPEEDAKSFSKKAPLVATIKIMEADKPVQRVATLNPPADPKEERASDRNWLGKAEAMRKKVMAEPLKGIMLPLEGSDEPGVVEWATDAKGNQYQIHKSGSVWPVTQNGFKYLVPKGKMVDVPESVYEILANAINITASAGRELRIDRKDPNTGGTVADQLR